MAERGQDGIEGFIPELVRKAVERSVKALLQSEEGMRGVVHAVLPRELLSNLTQQVDGAKRDAVAMIGREMQAFLHNLNVGEELSKILTSVQFEIHTSVRFIPNDDGTLRSVVKTSAKPTPAAKTARKTAKKAPAAPKSRVRRAAAVLVGKAAEVAGDTRAPKT
jgi:hypothetical protein